uniref:CSON009155 protein n=1 Tax=Culicoides sonorensis TaxID=179676 RepID=A0A336LK70_CULSO
MRTKSLVLFEILTLTLVLFLTCSDAQIPNAHICSYSGGTWAPSFECLERCMKNPKRKHSLAVCSMEKCFCKQPLAIPRGRKRREIEEMEKIQNYIF